ALHLHHVVANRVEDEGEGPGRALLLDEADGDVGHLDDLVLLVGQLTGPLLQGAGQLVLAGLGVDLDRPLPYRDLPPEHVLAAGPQCRQEPLDFLLADLTEELLELLLGVLVLLAGLFLVLNGLALVAFLDLLLGVVAVLGAFLDALAGVALLTLLALLPALLTTLLAALLTTLLAALLALALA